MSRNMQNNKKREMRKTWGDIIFNRLALLVAMLIVYIIYILNAASNTIAAYSVMLWGAALLVCGGAVFTVLAVLRRRAGRNDAKRITFAPAFLAPVCFVSALFLLFTFTVERPSALILASFAIVALVFVNYTFPRDFFWLSVCCAASCGFTMLPKIVRFEGALPNAICLYAASAIALLVPVCFCVYCAFIISGKRPEASGKFFNRGYARRYPLFLLPALCAALVGVSFFAAAYVSYALITVLVVYFLFLIIYAFDSTR